MGKIHNIDKKDQMLVEKLHHLYITGENMKWFSDFGNQLGSFL